MKKVVWKKWFTVGSLLVIASACQMKRGEKEDSKTSPPQKEDSSKPSSNCPRANEEKPRSCGSCSSQGESAAPQSSAPESSVSEKTAIAPVEEPAATSV